MGQSPNMTKSNRVGYGSNPPSGKSGGARSVDYKTSHPKVFSPTRHGGPATKYVQSGNTKHVQSGVHHPSIKASRQNANIPIPQSPYMAKSNRAGYGISNTPSNGETNKVRQERMFALV